MCGYLPDNPRNPFSGWLASRILGNLDQWADRWYHEIKLELFRKIRGRVVEIGAGGGINFSYYPPGTRVVAVEPNRFMHLRLKQRARDAGIRLSLLPTGAEAIDLPDQWADHVVGTLVLCSVPEPANVLAEIQRIVKPGGHYHFIEHVRGPGWTGLTQSAMHWPWRLVFDGCRLDRDSAATIRGARMGWTVVSRCQLGPRYLPVRPHILGRVSIPETTPTAGFR